MWHLPPPVPFKKKKPIEVRKKPKATRKAKSLFKMSEAASPGAKVLGQPRGAATEAKRKLAADNDEEDDEDDKLSKWPLRCTEELESPVCLTLPEGKIHEQQSRGKSDKVLWCSPTSHGSPWSKTRLASRFRVRLILTLVVADTWC